MVQPELELHFQGGSLEENLEAEAKIREMSMSRGWEADLNVWKLQVLGSLRSRIFLWAFQRLLRFLPEETPSGETPIGFRSS